MSDENAVSEGVANTGSPFDIGTLAPGQTFEWPVVRSPDFVTRRGDIAAVWAIPGNDVSLSILAFDGRTQNIGGEVVVLPNGATGQHLTIINGGPVIHETAAVRLSPAAALQAATVMLRVLAASGAFTEAQITEALAQASIGPAR
jgi:hypothetical protein